MDKMTNIEKKAFMPQVRLSSEVSSQPRFSDARVAINYDPYAVLKNGMSGIGTTSIQKQPGQVGKYQLLNGINDAKKYADDLRQRTGLVYFARYYSGHEKYPPINSDGQSILQDIISDADYFKDKISTYTPKQMSDAWNKMNALVVSLRKQELASK
jgi:hypothetical protein